MKVDKSIFRLIAELEYQIGIECYNPSSYDGNTGEAGRYFRYPVTIKEKPDLLAEKKFNCNMKNIFSNSLAAEIFNVEISNETILSMKYQFGSNQLYIGKGIINILQFLEERYDLDFNELEEKLNQTTSL